MTAAEITLAAGRLVVDAAWPIITLVLAYAFRKHIGDLIGRLRKLPGAIELDQQQAQQPEKGADPSAVPGAIDASGKLALPTTVYSVWPPFREQLEAQIERDLVGLSAGEREPHLRGYLVMARRAVQHLNAVRVIFGSQLELLARGGGNADGLVVERVIKECHDMHVARGGDMPIAEWLAYPRNTLLISGDEKELRVTAVGRDFLTFVTTFLGETAQRRPY